MATARLASRKGMISLWEWSGTPIPSFPLNREGELRVWMKQRTISSTDESQAEYLPRGERQEGVGFCGR
jgi:hypothetical protein